MKTYEIKYTTTYTGDYVFTKNVETYYEFEVAMVGKKGKYNVVSFSKVV